MTLQQKVESLSVVDQTTYDEAVELLLGVNKAIKRAEEILGPPVKSAYAHALELANHKKKFVGPLEDFKVTLTKSMSNWVTMMENRRKEEERVAREEAEALEAEERLRLQQQSDEAAEAGDELLAEELQTQAATVFVPAVSQSAGVSKTKGISHVTDYEIEVINLGAFLKAVISKKVRLDLASICKIRLDIVKTYIRNSKHTDIPGLRVREIKKVRGTGQ